MKFINNIIRNKSLVLNLLFCISAFLLFSCGSGGGSGDSDGGGTGSIAFTLAIKDDFSTETRQLIAANTNGNICDAYEIDKIAAYVFDENDSEIAKGGPWDCSLHSGTIKDVPAGDKRIVIIKARNYSEDTILGGRSEPLRVEAGLTKHTELIELLGASSLPITSDDSAETDEDQEVKIAVLNNDKDTYFNIDGNYIGTLDPASITIVSPPNRGSAESNDNGTVTYIPDADYYGPDSFEYTVQDNHGKASKAKSVEVEINPINDDPMAGADSVTVVEGSSVSFEVLNNDSDVEGDELSVSNFTQPTNGSVAQDGNMLIYTADFSINFTSVDNFNYTVSDGKGGTAMGEVSLTVLAAIARASIPPPEADDWSDAPSISPDGRFVAFRSLATNLVPGDTNESLDIFVHDRKTKTTERVSVDSEGTEADDTSEDASVSSDGRYVAFRSFAANLVNDTNNVSDIFLHDRQENTTIRVSEGPDLVEANGYSDDPVISLDGRYVAYTSLADNLALPDMLDTNKTLDIFVYWTESARTELVSVDSEGVQANRPSFNPSISSGEFVESFVVTFVSRATNLVPEDTNGADDIFVFDGDRRQIDRVSVSSDGLQANANSYNPAISANGRYVAFSSRATNLVPGDTNDALDIFVHEIAGQTRRVSISSNGIQANGDCWEPSISPDGRYVSFWSNATNLVPGDTNDTFDIFVHDLETGSTERFSTASDGSQGDGLSANPAISSEGRFVAFASSATNLVPDDQNGVADIFVHQRQPGTTVRVSLPPSEANDGSAKPSIDSEGRFIAFESDATNLVAGDVNEATDIFVHDRQLLTTELISMDSLGTQANDDSRSPSISEGGNFIAFSSLADNLVSDDSNKVEDVFVHDRTTGSVERVSIIFDNDSYYAGSFQPFISANGNFVVFSANFYETPSVIYVFDRSNPQTMLVSRGFDGSWPNSYSFSPSISADGGLIAFGSLADNLVSNDENQFEDIFIFDRISKTTERISIGYDGSEADGYSSEPFISPDGRFVAFASRASNLVPNDGDSTRDVFLYDRVNRTMERIGAAPVTFEVDAEPSISYDGLFVAFVSGSALVKEDGNESLDVYVYDRKNKILALSSFTFEGTLANHDSWESSISPDGQYIAFRSYATNLVADDNNGVSDIFATPNPLGF